MAPPVYRPQPLPVVLQRKQPVVKQAQPIKQQPKPVAPPVYRPLHAPKVLQAKQPTINRQINKPASPPKAPPVYRPQATPKVLQTKTARGNQQGADKSVRQPPVSPPVYRPSAKKPGNVSPTVARSNKSTGNSDNAVVQRIGLWDIAKVATGVAVGAAVGAGLAALTVATAPFTGTAALVVGTVGGLSTLASLPATSTPAPRRRTTRTRTAGTTRAPDLELKVPERSDSDIRRERARKERKKAAKRKTEWLKEIGYDSIAVLGRGFRTTIGSAFGATGAVHETHCADLLAKITRAFETAATEDDCDVFIDIYDQLVDYIETNQTGAWRDVGAAPRLWTVAEFESAIGGRRAKFRSLVAQNLVQPGVVNSNYVTIYDTQPNSFATSISIVGTATEIHTHYDGNDNLVAAHFKPSTKRYELGHSMNSLTASAQDAATLQRFVHAPMLAAYGAKPWGARITVRKT